MSTLQITAQFFSLREDITIPGSDLAAFRYNAREADCLEDSLEQYKKSFCENQEKAWKLSNRRPFRLKEQLEDFENILLSHSPVYSNWHAANYMVYVFHSGIIVHLTINVHNSDVVQLVIDRTMEGKLLSDITSIGVTKDSLFITYGMPQITIIQSSKQIFHPEQPNLLSQCALNVQDVILPGPGTRRHERKLFMNTDKTVLCVWWVREGSDLYAWSPVVRAEDRANILLYSLKPNTFMDLIACKRTENDPAGLEFCSRDSSVLRLTEIISTAKGRVNIVSTLFKVYENLQQIQQRVLRINCPPRCFAYSPDDQLLFLGCVDASIIIWHLDRDTCSSAKATFIPFHACWHSSSAMLVVSSDRGLLQCWDRALNPSRVQLRNSAPCREQGGQSVIHLGQYLRMNPAISLLKWADQFNTEEQPPVLRQDTSGTFKRGVRQKSYRSTRRKLKFKTKLSRQPKQLTLTASSPAQYLFVLFERGPLLCLRFSTGCYPGSSSLNALALCSEYLQWDLQDQAVQLLLSLNWTSLTSFEEEDLLLCCFTRVTNSLLRMCDSDAKSERLLEGLLLHLTDIVQEDAALAEPIWDAARRCCRSFLRANKLAAAAKIAFRVQDPDLLVELVLHARGAGDEALVSRATAALNYVKTIRNDSCSSSCSSSCDTCSESCSSHSSCCSSCGEESHSEQQHSAATSERAVSRQFSDLRLGDDTEDQVRVVSFGVV